MIKMLVRLLMITAAAYALHVQDQPPARWVDKTEQEPKNDHLPVGGYVSSINTPYYTNALTKRILREFDELAGGGAVLYGKTEVFLDRKITIKDSPTCNYTRNNIKHSCAGVARTGATECNITVKQGKSPELYRQVLLHEYMHCMGVDDNDNPSDLMYKIENMAPEENIQYYANEAATRQTIWKNLLNLSSSIKQIK